MFTGGVYVYSNLRGCDGGRVYYDGTSVISLNGEIMMMSEMFDLDDCDVLIGCMDLEEVTRLRISDKNWAD
jgi:NAD+ synthase (glutamine-hydrolysing)